MLMLGTTSHIFDSISNPVFVCTSDKAPNN